MTDLTDVQITCVTPPHMQQEVLVSVLDPGRGRAAGTVTFTYDVQLSSISHCSG